MAGGRDWDAVYAFDSNRLTVCRLWLVMGYHCRIVGVGSKLVGRVEQSVLGASGAIPANVKFVAVFVQAGGQTIALLDKRVICSREIERGPCTWASSG
jgi:hypothetical protein